MMIDPANKAASQRFRDSVPLLERPEELRERAEQEGYLFFRNVLDHETRHFMQAGRCIALLLIQLQICVKS